MGKSLDELRADAQAAELAYRKAMEKSEAKFKHPDDGIRPKFVREDARDENGNPIKLDKFGNPEWQSGHRIEGARARPVYRPPLRSPYSEAGAPPPDIDFKGTGTWEETEALWRDLIDVLNQVDNKPLTQEERETCVQQIVPSLLDRLAGTVPRIDCAFPDGPMGKGSWLALVGKYQTAFNPSKTLERSIGTMRSRTAPKFLSFALDGAKWLFRRCPSGIPEYKPEEPHKPGSLDSGPTAPQAPRKRGRPKKVTEAVTPNVE